MTLVDYVILAAALASVVLAIVGRRVPVDAHCRRCGFSLAGHDERAKECPECGIRLRWTSSRSVSRTRHLRSRPMIAAAGATALLTAWAIVGARTVNRPNPAFPLALAPGPRLVQALMSDWVDFGLVPDQWIFAELGWRVQRRALDAASLDALLSRALLERIAARSGADSGELSAALSGVAAPVLWERERRRAAALAADIDVDLVRDRWLVVRFHGIESFPLRPVLLRSLSWGHPHEAVEPTARWASAASKHTRVRPAIAVFEVPPIPASVSNMSFDVLLSGDLLSRWQPPYRYMRRLTCALERVGTETRVTLVETAGSGR